MKRRLFRKIQAGILAFAMTTELLAVSMAPVTVQAADTTRTINLGASVLAPSDGKWDAENDHKIYFGQYGVNPTAFRVLKGDTNTMLLDCDTILLSKAFDADETANPGQTSGKPNEWKGSDLESYLNDEYYTSTSVFTSLEKNAIANTSLPAKEYSVEEAFPNATSYKDYAAKDYVFLLSAEEANILYADNNARKKQYGLSDDCSWWLRSADADAYNMAGAKTEEGISSAMVTPPLGVSPAFNLNLSSVLFTSADRVRKSSDTLTQITSDSATKNWKITLLDESKTVGITSGHLVTQTGSIITVPYTYSGDDLNQISVMITSGAYTEANTEILYYGKLDTSLNNSDREGTGTFTLPDGLPAEYKIYIMAEDVETAKHTDYASEPVEITVAETVAAPTSNLTDTEYSTEQVLRLSSATEGAEIYYTMTTDGSEPTDPSNTTSTIYDVTNGISLTGTAGSSITYKIKAIAVKDGMQDSAVTSQEYVIREEASECQHIPEIRGQKEATCTEEGYTGDKYCKTCGELLSKGETIAKLEHTEVIDEAVAPTCTEPGKTEGSHCSVCGTVIKAQEEIPATGHSWDNHYTVDKAATTREEGKRSIHCKNCDATKDEQVIPKLSTGGSSSGSSGGYVPTYVPTYVPGNNNSGGSAQVTPTDHTDTSNQTTDPTKPQVNPSDPTTPSVEPAKPDEPKVTQTTNKYGNVVQETEQEQKDDAGNVIGTSIKSEILTGLTDGVSSITVNVGKDMNGAVTNTSAKIVAQLPTVTQRSVFRGKMISQIVEAAGTDDIDVKLRVENKNGSFAYSVTAKASDLTAGNKLYLVAKNTVGDSALVNAKTYTVTKNGTVAVSAKSGKSYEFITASQMNSLSKQILNTIQAKNTSKTIQKSKTVQMAFKNTLNMDNVKSVAYSVSDKSVATVTKKGVVKGKKSGTAVVKAKVTLKNGKSKTVKMNVTVK